MGPARRTREEATQESRDGGREDGREQGREDVGSSPSAVAAVSVIPTRGRMFVRGLLRRCPICGSGKLFTGYFRLKHHCPRCGLRFQRLEGQWSGDIGINTVVTFGLLYVVMMVGVIAFWGRLNVAALGVTGAIVVIVFPALFVPFAKTLWLAIDLMMRPVEDDEFGPPDQA